MLRSESGSGMVGESLSLLELEAPGGMLPGTGSKRGRVSTPPPPVSPVQACPRPSIDQRPQLRKWQRRFVYRRERQVPFVLVN